MKEAHVKKQKKENRDYVSFFSVFQIKEKVFASSKVFKKIPFFFSVTFHYGKLVAFQELFKAFGYRFLCNHYFRSILTSTF